MEQLWTIVLRDSLTSCRPIASRDLAIDAACKMIAKGIAVRLVSPIAVADEDDIVGERELRRIAAERGLLPVRAL